ncbi:DNA topoisomerase IV [Flavobacteriaceae bacterium]|nr:DNA topoisomerase IV [Flavobacteriaceae bacterium]
MKYLILCTAVLILQSCYNVERNCSDFKTGSFESEITIDGTLYKSSFSRTSNLQVEEFKGVKDSSYVRWINDCEMVFKTIHPKNRAEKKDILLKILTTTKEGYKFEYGYVGDPNKQIGYAKRIN